MPETTQFICPLISNGKDFFACNEKCALYVKKNKEDGLSGCAIKIISANLEGIKDFNFSFIKEVLMDR